MQAVVLSISATIALLITGYTHYRLGAHTRGAWNRRLLRATLILASVCLGVLSIAELSSLESALSIVTAFGVIHFPAAIILFIKGQAGSSR